MTTSDIITTIQSEMRAAFPVVEGRLATFYAMQEYHLGWRDADLRPAQFDPGKLLRPQFALLACQAVGGDIDRALPLAAGIQLIHDFSLIHDDIEDNSDTRRGRTTVWRQWGLAHGINAGDGMFVIAHLALHRMSDAGVEPSLALDIIRRFDRTVLNICGGQFLDLSFEGNLDITEEDYLMMIGCKTAALIAATTELGAMAGGADAVSVQAMADFGRNLGLAFQVQDDVLGVWGDAQTTGKPFAADIYRRKVSLPIVYALHVLAPGGERGDNKRSDLERIYCQDQVGDADVSRVLGILESVDARGYTETMAERYHDAAMQALSRVRVASDPDAQAAFARIQQIAESLLGRQN